MLLLTPLAVIHPFLRRICMLEEEQEKIVDLQGKEFLLATLQALFLNLQQEHSAIIDKDYNQLQTALQLRNQIIDRFQQLHIKLFSRKCHSVYTLLQKIEQQHAANHQ